MGSDDDHARLQELVDQLGSETTAEEYTSADDDLCTCISFEVFTELQSIKLNMSMVLKQSHNLNYFE